MEEKKYLPIGSVVLLKGGNKELMITGFCVIPNDNSHKMYDYSGFLYPEGCIDSSEVYLFNHSQIENILFKGYVNEKEKEFKDELEEVAKKIVVDSDNNIISDNLSDTVPMLNDPFIANTEFSINNNIFN